MNKSSTYIYLKFLKILKLKFKIPLIPGIDMKKLFRGKTYIKFTGNKQTFSKSSTILYFNLIQLQTDMK